MILPLRNGKFIELGGVLRRDKSERHTLAADGKEYGFATGMIEVFDPETFETTLQTNMSFSFIDSVAEVSLGNY